MKPAILLIALFLLPSSMSAQLFSREPMRGAALGGLLGGIIGHNSNRKTTEGIGIGAGTGWLLGNLSRNHRERGSYDTYIPSRRRSVYADSVPVGNRPNYAITGAAVGAVTGAVIGHNQNRRTMEGLGIGAVSGLAVGGLAEYAARKRETRHYFAEEAPPRYNVKFHANAPQVITRTRTVTTTQPIRTTSPRSVFKRVESSSTTGNWGRRLPVQKTTTVTQPIRAQRVVINNYYVGQNPPKNFVAPAWK